jgi:DNA-binding PadR family transcriptional regulator
MSIKNNNPALTEAVYYILLSLLEPLHGYGIIQNVIDLTDNRVDLAPGTLYGALNTLQEKGLIKPYQSDDDSRRKEYVITKLGEEILLTDLSRLKELVKNGDKYLGGEDNEDY